MPTIAGTIDDALPALLLQFIVPAEEEMRLEANVDVKLGDF
jgi:hypothetical protein